MIVQKYRVFQSRLIAIDADSMFNRDCHSVVVTHADYRALEERLAESSARENFLADEVIHMAEELASIKARVDELVVADHEYDICSLEFRDAYNEGCEETEDLADDVSGASERRRLALEAFK